MLIDTLSEDLKAAMRSKDPVRLRTIRALRAALKDKEIDLRASGESLTEEAELAVLQKQAKQRQDSIDQFVSAGREDLASKEREELEIIRSYLPAEMGDDEIREVIRRLIEESGAAGPGDIGRVMGPAMQQLRGRADGRRVQQIARELLSPSS